MGYISVYPVMIWRIRTKWYVHHLTLFLFLCFWVRMLKISLGKFQLYSNSIINCSHYAVYQLLRTYSSWQLTTYKLSVYQPLLISPNLHPHGSDHPTAFFLCIQMTDAMQSFAFLWLISLIKSIITLRVIHAVQFGLRITGWELQWTI